MREGCHETPRGDDLLVVGTEEKWLVTHDLSCRSPSLSGSTGWVWRMKLGYERRLSRGKAGITSQVTAAGKRTVSVLGVLLCLSPLLEGAGVLGKAEGQEQDFSEVFG